jgi:hypothetical protein
MTRILVNRRTERRRKSAVRLENGLCAKGPNGSPVVPELVRTLKGEGLRFAKMAAADALGSLVRGDTNVIATLNEAAKDHDFLVCEAAAKAGVKRPSP